MLVLVSVESVFNILNGLNCLICRSLCWWDHVNYLHLDNFVRLVIYMNCVPCARNRIQQCVRMKLTLSCCVVPTRCTLMGVTPWQQRHSGTETCQITNLPAASRLEVRCSSSKFTSWHRKKRVATRASPTHKHSSCLLLRWSYRKAESWPSSAGMEPRQERNMGLKKAAWLVPLGIWKPRQKKKGHTTILIRVRGN